MTLVPSLREKKLNAKNTPLSRSKKMRPLANIATKTAIAVNIDITKTGLNPSKYPCHTAKQYARTPEIPLDTRDFVILNIINPMQMA
jgi:hypothetical protein